MKKRVRNREKRSEFFLLVFSHGVLCEFCVVLCFVELSLQRAIFVLDIAKTETSCESCTKIKNFVPNLTIFSYFSTR